MTRHVTGALNDHSRLWIALILGGVAVALAVGSSPSDSLLPNGEVAAAPIRQVTSVRAPTTRPELKLGRFSFSCSECHRNGQLPYVAGHTWTSHTNIQMAHGINNRCLNCHHAVNREVFADEAGSEIPWSHPELLCAKCHGPVFRDWQHGVHGRTNGYWDASRGESLRLTCVECHDPHHPRFPTLASDPGPHTLRVHPHALEREVELRNPLRIRDNMLTDRYARGGGESP